MFRGVEASSLSLLECFLEYYNHIRLFVSLFSPLSRLSPLSHRARDRDSGDSVPVSLPHEEGGATGEPLPGVCCQ